MKSYFDDVLLACQLNTALHSILKDPMGQLLNFTASSPLENIK